MTARTESQSGPGNDPLQDFELTRVDGPLSHAGDRPGARVSP
jgi:hypothetical protein